MRLIDADDLVYVVIGEDTDDNPLRFVPTEFIENAPTIDAEQVVRCKDCKHWVWPNTCGDEVITRYENDFCSRGERKEDE